jgi:tetratricopeptide (TPR) repeat protein
MIRLNEALDEKKAAAQRANDAATAAGAPDPEMETLKKKYAELEKQNYFEVLGMTPQSSPADVKKAYFKLAKQYHPDTLPPDAAADRRKLVDSIFAVISQAQKVLEDPKQREAYVNDLKAKESGTDAGAAETILMAELEFQKAEVMLKKKDLPNARKHLTEALKLNPTEAEHHVYWGWLLWLESKKQQDAVKHIEAGLKIRTNIPAAFLFLGHIYKALNDLEKAEKAYRKCIVLDDKNQEAMSELRVMAMRKGKK